MMSRRTLVASGLSLAALGSARASTAVTTIKTADGRDLQVSLWSSVGPRRGVILFSHGALSMPEKYERLIPSWAQAGFEIFAPLHMDSTDHPDHANFKPELSWFWRIQDVRAVSAFMNAPGYIAAGHSYGGLTALTLGGVQAVIPPGIKGPLRDPRAKCAVAFSPPPPMPDRTTREGYATLAVPAIIQSGTRDNFMTQPWQVHMTAYDVAPPKDKYGLVLDGVDHYFGGLICESDKPGPPQTEQLAIAIDLSTSFIEAYGVKDAKALKHLSDAVGDHGLAHLTRK
jgi:predicted dienelactone hydrolase